MSESHQLIHQDSGQVEWYTPAPIIEAARATMGGIDLDPASSAAANETVRAGRFFTEADNGLAQLWRGRVWLNPPFSDNAVFVRRVVADYKAGHIPQACVMTFASLDTQWARWLAAFPRWYATGRVAYVAGWEIPPARQLALWEMGEAVVAELPEKDGPPKASMVTYLGAAVERFVAEFTGRLGGWVDVPWSWHERVVGEMTAASPGMNLYRKGDTDHE